ncbi:MAG: MBL fold metallo-hydrolase [bacterium]|nr:MBL fold metallo-hydrolase [bacterium]
MGADGLHLIDLDQPLPGQRRFISSWARVDGPVSFVVDPGPPRSIDLLVARLRELGLRRLDLILLTHVHLDHGGGTAQLLEAFPEAHVVCHPEGRRHLADPARLWAGSRQVLGAKAQVYGEPRAVPSAAITDETAAARHGIDVIPTPGHAPHHVAFRDGDDLFVGEAAGTFSSLGQGPLTEGYYLRPATPPRFRPETAQASLDRLLALDPLPKRLRFAHHGWFGGDGRRLLAVARAQIDLWLAACREGLDACPEANQRGADAGAGLLDDIAERVRHRDPRFARGEGLDADIRERERDFTHQSLRGMLGHLLDAGD